MLCQVSLKQFLSILSKNNSQGVGRISNLKQTKRLIKQKKKKEEGENGVKGMHLKQKKSPLKKEQIERCW